MPKSKVLNKYCESCNKGYPNTIKYYSRNWCGNLSRICRKYRKKDVFNEKE